MRWEGINKIKKNIGLFATKSLERQKIAGIGRMKILLVSTDSRQENKF